MLLLLIIAFISGLVTILAPCIWPLLPIILSTSFGATRQKSFGITLGIIISFGVVTLSISYLVSVLKFDTEILRYFAVIVVGFLGVTLVVPALSRYLEAQVGKLSGKFGTGGQNNRSGFWGGLTIGLALGLVWTPCAGPILATVATLAATRAVNFGIVLVTIAYLIGVALPLFFFSQASSKVFSRAKLLNKYTGRVQQVFGIVMILTAFAIFTGYDRTLQTKLLDVFPSYSNFLIKLESSGGVGQTLDRLKDGRNKDTSDESVRSDLKVLGNAPEFAGVSNWLNSDPLTMASLKGKVVLVDFWTYTCINCIRTLPYVTSWYEKYKDMGFVVVGVHTPEFEFEKKTENVQSALGQYKINYPVAQDSDYKTWNNFRNRYWPAKYLIDANGKLRYTHFGEGEYKETEENIQALIREAGQPVTTSIDASEDTKGGFSFGLPTTPETYLGLSRIARFASKERPKNGVGSYSTGKLSLSDFAYQGVWDLEDEYGQCESNCSLVLNFYAKKVFLVITPVNDGESAEVLLDDKKLNQGQQGTDVTNSVVNLDRSRLYNLISLGTSEEHILRLNFKNQGTRVFAFTFE